MARSPFTIRAVNNVGAVVSDAVARVRGIDAGPLVSIFATRVGGDPLAQPVAVDPATGKLTVWLEPGDYEWSATSGVTELPWEPFVVPSAGGDSGPETDPVASAALAAIPVPLQLNPANVLITVPPQMVIQSPAAVLNRAFFQRVVVPRACILRDFTIWVMAGNGAGHVHAAIYNDEGARLWVTNPHTTIGANGSQIIGDPNLAVTDGKVLWLALSSNTTAGRYLGLTSAGLVGRLFPASWWSSGQPRVLGSLDASHPPPASVDFSTLLSTSDLFSIAMRMT